MHHPGFHLLDWLVFVGYLAGVFAVGAWFSRRQTDTREFFVAGGRMHWLPVSMSVVASLFSGISFIGHPARVFRYDCALLAWPVAGALATPVAVYVLLPFYRRLQVTSAYEYLEKRFNPNVRLLASALFVGKRFLWMTLVALAPSLALSTCTNLPVECCIIIIGLGATIYTALGGIKAVIWVDVLHFLVLVCGLLVILFFVIGQLNGTFTQIGQTLYAEHKAWASLDVDFSRLTFWTVLVAGLVLILSDLGADQMTVQRLMTTPDEKAARKILLFNALVNFPAMFLMLSIGLALWAYYKQYPHLLALPEQDYDKIVPYFVVSRLPAGLSGIVIAAIFAGSMSSFDAGLNAMVTALTVDWFKRFAQAGKTDRHYLLFAKGLTFALGVLITLVAIIIFRTGLKTIIDQSNTYLGYFGGALLGIYLLGVLTRRAKSLPTLAGAAAGVAIIFLIDRRQSATTGYWLDPYMYACLSCVLTMMIGYLGSLPGPAPPFDKVKAYTLARGGRTGPR